jgi:hypothetical protein
MDIRELNRRAVQATVEMVGMVTANDLDRPTPMNAIHSDTMDYMIWRNK